MAKVIKATFTEENRPIKVGDLVFLVYAEEVVPVYPGDIDKNGGYIHGDHINLGDISVDAGYATEESEPVPEDLSTGEIFESLVDLSQEVEALGNDVLKMREHFEEVLAEMYAESKSNLTSAERLQYAIDLGASEDNVRTFFESLIIANGEYTDKHVGVAAEAKLAELREIIEVYQKYRRSIIDEMLAKSDGGDVE